MDRKWKILISFESSSINVSRDDKFNSDANQLVTVSPSAFLCIIIIITRYQDAFVSVVPLLPVIRDRSR